ncbi:hypothetical protein EI94DRAFT_1708086 [Lactarius quietus]|nr:hypothetical protein EI94DRAFT_1708086 [Lactarius quietus]
MPPVNFPRFAGDGEMGLVDADRYRQQLCCRVPGSSFATVATGEHAQGTVPPEPHVVDSYPRSPDGRPMQFTRQSCRPSKSLPPHGRLLIGNRYKGHLVSAAL